MHIFLWDAPTNFKDSWIKSATCEYSCDEEYLEEFIKGNTLKLLAVLPQNWLDPKFFEEKEDQVCFVEAQLVIRSFFDIFPLINSSKYSSSQFYSHETDLIR